MWYSQIWQNFRGDKYMQIRQRICKCFTMQICHLLFTAFWNFWHITRFFTTNHHWVINAQTGPFFWPPLYYTTITATTTTLPAISVTRLIYSLNQISSDNASFSRSWKLVLWAAFFELCCEVMLSISLGTNLIHDFTAMTFSVKLTSFREKTLMFVKSVIFHEF